jgi:hypothetical protein
MQQVPQNVGPSIERKQEMNKYPNSQDSRFGPLQKVLNRNHKVFFIYPKYSELSGFARSVIEFYLPKYFRELKKFSETMSVV